MLKKTIALSLTLLINAPQLAAGVWRTSREVKLQGDEAAAIEIAEKHRTAIGSREAEEFKTIEEQREVQVLGQTNKVTRLSEPPTRRFYSIQVGANGTTEMGFDGKRVWQKTPFFRGYLPPSDPAAKRILQGGNESPLLSYKTTGRKIFRLPNEKIEGKDYLVVATTTLDFAAQDIPVRFYVDPATYFVKRIERGDAVKQVTILDDYRKVDGIWTAFTQTTITPTVTVVARITSLKHNVPIDPAKFEYSDGASKPAATNSPAPEATKPSPTPDDNSAEIISESRRIETFEFAWNKINDTFWDRKFNGIDWKGIHDKYLPIIKTTSSSTEFHRLLDRMVQELHLSHFRVLPPGDVVGLNTRPGERHGSIGADFRWLGGQLVVVDLAKDYPASVAGIRKGFVVTKINGQTPDQIFLKSKEDSRFHPQEGFARGASCD